MKVEKKYYSIKEVSKMLNIKEHVIRHWDSIDPKTNKLRVDNLSIRTKGGTRFFNKTHIKKISNLFGLLRENGKRNYSLDLASKILLQNKNNKQNLTKNKNETKFIDSKNLESIDNITLKLYKITNNLKKLLNNK